MTRSATRGDRRRYDSIDFLKCLACIGVVLIHVKFPGTTGMAVSAIPRFAVPLFFAIAVLLAVNMVAHERDSNPEYADSV